MFDEMEQLDEHENQCSMSLIDEVEMQDERIHMGENHAVIPNVTRNSPTQWI